MTPNTPLNLRPTNPTQRKRTTWWARLLHPDIHATLSIAPDQHSHQTSHSRLASFRYALAGTLYMIRYQPNVRIQVVIAAVVLFVGLWLAVSAEGLAILIIVIALNLFAEFTNAAIEAAVNLASATYHPMARVAKDVAAGTSLVMAVTAVIVGLLILGPPLLARLSALLGH